MLICIQNKLLNLILHRRDIVLMPNSTDTSKLTKDTFNSINSFFDVMETLQTGNKSLLCVINRYFKRFIFSFFAK